MTALEWLLRTPFAHRGLYDGAAGVPENSMAAFEAAAEAGYGIELDARLAADGVPVVYHDATLERLTDLEGPLAGRSAAELSGTRLQGSDQRIPRLAQVLDLVAGRTPLLVELKSPWRRTGPLERPVSRLLENYPGACAVLSFNPLSLAWFRRHAPALPRGQNLAPPGRGHARLRDRAAQGLWRRLGRPHFISQQMDGLDQRVADRVHGQGLLLIAWTVRTEAERTKALRYADNFMFEGLRP